MSEKTTYVKYGKWYGVRVCKECDHILKDDGDLSYSEIHDSKGICPHCGYNSTSTTCSYITKIYRRAYTYIPHWWEFWKSSEYEILEAKKK